MMRWRAIGAVLLRRRRAIEGCAWLARRDLATVYRLRL
jgi:hypothetical protein